MKKLICGAFLAVFAASAAFAQSGSSVEKQVSHIRNLYSEAKEKISMMEEVGIPANDMTITYNYMAPAIGQVSSTDRVWYELHDQETETSFKYYYYPIFATRHYNITVRDVYEEYLYDTENECLVFFYYREKWPEGGELIEDRYYWNEKGELIRHIGTSPDNDHSAEAIGNRFVLQLDVMTIYL